ncbi:MAG: hypothetical protein ACTSUE_04370 [Promethearchaeota archaeon]
MSEIIEDMKAQLKRVDFSYNLRKIKVVVLEPIPKLTITFTDTGPVTIGPYRHDEEVLMPVWLMKVLKSTGHVILHKDERTDDYYEMDPGGRLEGVPEYFYAKTFDWLDSLDKLVAKRIVSENNSKKLKSTFISFQSRRFSTILNSLTLPPASFFKKLSGEERIVAKFLQDAINSWERIVLKREK